MTGNKLVFSAIRLEDVATGLWLLNPTADWFMPFRCSVMTADSISVGRWDVPNSGDIRTADAGSATYYDLKSGDGSAYKVAIKLIGGYANIPRAGDITMLDDKFIQIGKDSDGTLPTPSADYRGKMIRVEGGAGVADKLYMCMKSAADTYSWVQIASG